MSFGLLAGDTVQKELDRIGVSGVAFYHKAGESIAPEAVQAVAGASIVQAVMPLAMASGTVQLRNMRSAAGILGIDANLNDVFQLEVYHGALPTAAQVRGAAKIAVVDAELAQSVYRRTNIVGKTLYVTVNGRQETMKVCAVIRSQSKGLSAIFGGQMPYLLYVPYTTLQAMDPTLKTDKLIANMEENPAVTEQLLRKLNRLFGNNYQFENLNQYFDSFSAITDAVTLLISGIAAISVVVGGIGVMNAMVASVDARTREIGIYRALGAKKRIIVQTYLCEAVLLCVLGGLSGVVCSAVTVQFIRSILGASLYYSGTSLLISLGISVVCGGLFGMLPALRAAKLDPIEAIRWE